MPPEFWKTDEGRRIAAAVVAGLLLLVSCGNDDDGATADDGGEASTTTSTGSGQADDVGFDVESGAPEFVGTLDGDDDVYVAVVRGEEAAIVYLCDGETIAEAFLGEVDGDSATLASPAGGELTVTWDGDEAAGTGRLGDGTEVAFTTTEVDPEGEAGAFFALPGDDDALTEGDYGGWIVLPDGSQRGAIRIGGTLSDGGTLDPATGQVNRAVTGTLSSRTTGYINMIEV